MKNISWLLLFLNTICFGQVINFPNPAFKAKLLHSDTTNYIAGGMLLDTKFISSDLISIDVSGYANGVYFVRCTIDNAVQTIKVVKR